MFIQVQFTNISGIVNSNNDVDNITNQKTIDRKQSSSDSCMGKYFIIFNVFLILKIIT